MFDKDMLNQSKRRSNHLNRLEKSVPLVCQVKRLRKMETEITHKLERGINIWLRMTEGQIEWRRIKVT